jgi:hypothetical protein
MDKSQRIVFAAGLEALSKGKTAVVSFRGCACGDGGIKGFNEGAAEIADALTYSSSPAVLESLDLSGVGFSVKTAAQLGSALSACKALRKLDLSHNPLLSDAAMKLLSPGFAGLVALQDLVILGSGLSDSGVYHLCSGLRKGPPPGQARVRVVDTAEPVSQAVRAMLRRGYLMDAYRHYHTRAGSLAWVQDFSTTKTSKHDRVQSMDSVHIAATAAAAAVPPVKAR